MTDESATVSENPHAEFIDKLGGPSAIAAWLSERRQKKISSQAVTMWKKRGIPFKWRGKLVVMANEKDISAPPNFFATETE